LDNFGATTTGSNYIAAAADLTDDLSDDHPVSMDYTTATASADGGLFNPSVATTSLGGTIADDLLINDKLECSSCHDAHDSAGVDDLLVMSNAASALCLTCHDK
ncbi:cytochrome c3 family protein, partial [Bacteroidota bacterium]